MSQPKWSHGTVSFVVESDKWVTARADNPLDFIKPGTKTNTFPTWASTYAAELKGSLLFVKFPLFFQRWYFLQICAVSLAPVCRRLPDGGRHREKKGMWYTQVRVHFSLCQLLIMLNYTFNTSGPLWTFLRVWGQAFPVSVNDPTSGELSCRALLSPSLPASLPPSFTLSLFWPLLY